MKANRKYTENNKAGVSAVIGVALMVTTIAIAATLSWYKLSTNYAIPIKQILCGHINRMPIRHTTDLLFFNGVIYIIDSHGIDDKDYAIMNYAYDNDCNCTITISELWSQPNTYCVNGDSAYLLNCGDK